MTATSASDYDTAWAKQPPPADPAHPDWPEPATRAPEAGHPSLLAKKARMVPAADLHPADLVRLGVRAQLVLAGEDPDRPGLTDTPDRVLRAWREMTGRPGDPATLLHTFFDDAGPVDEMVAVGPVEFTSLCEHHLLPFTGHAWIAYLPSEGVVGLSKLPRLLEHFARRPQVQERLTGQVTTALDEHVPSRGSACLLRAVHSCASMRGVRRTTPMTTSSLTGLFRTDPAARSEFLALTHQSTGHRS